MSFGVADRLRQKLAQHQREVDVSVPGYFQPSLSCLSAPRCNDIGNALRVTVVYRYLFLRPGGATMHGYELTYSPFPPLAYPMPLSPCCVCVLLANSTLKPSLLQSRGEGGRAPVSISPPFVAHVKSMVQPWLDEAKASKRERDANTPKSRAGKTMGRRAAGTMWSPPGGGVSGGAQIMRQVRVG